MRRIDLSSSLVAVLVLGCAGLALGQKEADPATASSIEVTVTGQNICLGCSLKTEKGAGAQCSVYGHKHALRVDSASAGERDLPAMAGWVLHYLETAKSEELINGHHDEGLTIVGTVYPNERVLEVVSVESGPAPSEHPDHPKKSEHPDHPK